MDYLYSLYDALVSINVPSDKARAVVDAMERDMGTTLATKQDLTLLATREDMLATKQDLKLLATREELLAFRQELRSLAGQQDLLATREELLVIRQDLKLLVSKEELMSTKQDLLAIRRDIELLRRDLAAQDLRMTVKLGSMVFVGFGLTIAAMGLWLR